MLTKVSTTILRQISDPKRKLKILTVPTHEGYQSMLGETGHEFYMLQGDGLKFWDFHTRPLPDNHYIFNLPVNQIRGDIPFDLILCQNRLQQYPLLIQIAERTGLPLVMLDHTEPPPGMPEHDLQQVKQFEASAYVFITEHNRKTWGFENREDSCVIPHGINTDIFKGYTGNTTAGVSVVNQFPGRDIFCGWTLWQNITRQVPMMLYGDNPGLSESVNNPYKLARLISEHRFFLNTSQLSPVPLSLLEAMACGCPPVSTAKQQIPSIIEHGVNGFISNDEKELVEYCHKLLQDQDLAKEMGQKARQTILDKFSIQQFINQWNDVFEQVVQI